MALAILSISVFALAETTSRCLAVIRLSRNYQTARAVLEQGESEFPLVSTNAPDDNKVSPVTYPNGYTFSRDLEAVDEEEKLYEVRTRVSWAEAGHSSFEEVVSLFYSTYTDLP